MPRPLVSLATLLALHASASRPALAGDLVYSAFDCAKTVLNRYLAHEHRPGDARFGLPDGRALDLSLGRELGSGLAGSVVEVKEATGVPEIERVLAEDPDGVVVKFPLAVKYTGGKVVFPHAAILQKQEAELYTDLYNQLPKLEADPLFPKDPYWKRGRLPDAPIIKTVKTDHGLLIFKRRITGKSLRELQETYRGSMPPEMDQSLHDLYDLAQTFYRRAEAPGALPIDPRGGLRGRHFWPDLNPSNLVWIDDPKEMLRLGFSRPGFALYEWGELMTRKYEAPAMTFEGFRREVKAAMAAAAPSEEVLDDLDRLGDDYSKLARTLPAEQAKPFARFVTELGAAKPALKPAQAQALFLQNQALFTGKFAFDGAGDTAAFLKNFWTPKANIAGAVEDGDKIRVFAHKGYAHSIAEALPRTFRGKAVEVLDTERADSIIDPAWYSKHAEHYYNDKPVVLVTGSTAGIGLELVKKLQAEGYRVIATGRAQSLARLTEAGLHESPDFLIRPLDVADSAQQEKLIAEITEKYGGVDVLVNNAGITYRSTVEHTAPEELLNEMKVNYLGPHELTQRVLPLLRMKGRGKIIYNSSVMGTMGVPTLGGYSATKHAIEGEAEALYHEVRGFGVNVSLVEPGYVNSGAAEKILRTPKAEAALADPNDPYHKAYQDMEKVTELGMKVTPATSTTVAADIAKVVGDPNPALRIRNTLDSKFFYWFKLLPEDTQKALMKAGYVDPDEWARLGTESGGK